MKKTKKLIALLLALLTMFNAFSVSAASPGAFTYREVWGHSNTIYLTTKNNIPLRTEPVADDSNIVARISKNQLIVGNGVVVNHKGNQFVRVAEGTSEYFIYVKNLKVHNNHNYVVIPGYEPIRICEDCGKVVLGTPDTTIVETGDTLDIIHAGLLVCSFVPTIGNICDLADATLSLFEGDINSAAIGFLAAIPVLGTLRYLDEAAGAVKLYENADTVIKAQMKNGVIEIFEDADSALLGKNLDDAFAATGKKILSKPGDIVQAHHIVCGKDESCGPARAILHYLEISINSYENGVWLCGKTNTCDDIGHHVGRHVDDYYQKVNEIVKNAYNNAGPTKEQKRKAVTNALSEIAESLKNGDILLNSYKP